MITFLQEIAQRLVKEHGKDIGAVTVIFPNRRAGLYFREYIKEQLTGPVWSPRILSFQDFIAYQSTSQVADKLYLTHRLFEVYEKVMKTKEGFDKFYYWGQMLLKDFDDVDKYLVNPENLYTNLSRQKQLDLTFDFLQPEQKEIIARFWQGFDKSRSEQKERFEFVWERLYEVYAAFNNSLKAENIAYEGMQYRYVAENIDRISFREMEGPVIFAGFNALTLAEEKIISWFIKNRQTNVIWDTDEYYMADTRQEAGHFLRKYRSSLTFSSSFPEQSPNYIKGEQKQIGITGVPQHVGQAKLVGQKLGELLRERPGIDLRKIAVVLADETLLFPVLHSLPDEVEAINVTMGFPLAYAPVNSLVEHILDLQRTIRTDPDGHVLFNFKPTLAIIRHPLIVPHNPQGLERVAIEIEKKNKVFLTAADLIDESVIHKIFVPAAETLIHYLSDVLLELHQLSEDSQSIEVEYIHHFYRILNRYEQLLVAVDQKTDLKSFSRLFKQLVRTERLPFTGEPLRGLQIMGVLETRNLDFEHIFVLSMNEDFFPSQGGKHSFIPYNLRKAYGLPNYDQQDAIYAYLFYRLLQRPKFIELFYNTEGNDLGGEEMSRFIQQLIYESGLEFKMNVLANYSGSVDAREVVIEKDALVMKSLSRFMKVDGRAPVKRLSPSALNTYLDCRLMFYFRHVADLYEKDGMDEDVDARSLGNVLHYAMEVLYLDYIKEKNSSAIDKADVKMLKKRVEAAAVKAFRQQFAVSDDRKFYFEGKNIIAKEIIKDFMKSILKLDEQYAPFEFVGAERKYELDLDLGSVGNQQAQSANSVGNRQEQSAKEKRDSEQSTVNNEQKNSERSTVNSELIIGLRGTIDRLDKKDGRVRLIDYKTGQDKHSFDNIEELFDRKRKNKAAFQTFYYALLYQYERQPGEVMLPAVLNKDAIFFGEDVLLKLKGGGKIDNAELYLDEYTARLKGLLLEIFDPAVPFDQTDDDRKCKFCAYRGVCERG